MSMAFAQRNQCKKETENRARAHSHSSSIEYSFCVYIMRKSISMAGCVRVCDVCLSVSVYLPGEIRKTELFIKEYTTRIHSDSRKMQAIIGKLRRELFNWFDGCLLNLFMLTWGYYQLPGLSYGAYGANAQTLRAQTQRHTPTECCNIFHNY